jgi:hypothetical protein
MQKARNNMPEAFYKLFNGGPGSGPHDGIAPKSIAAHEATQVANKTDSQKDHLKAAMAHLDAADFHRIEENRHQLQDHLSQAKFHLSKLSA